jgi:hypothetical protein
MSGESWLRVLTIVPGGGSVFASWWCWSQPAWTGLASHCGTSWHLPNIAVAYPFSRNVAFVFGRVVL